MGRDPWVRYDYDQAVQSRGITKQSTHVTAKAEEEVRVTGKLNPIVDPAVDPIRRSLNRFDPTSDGRWELTMGIAVPMETLGDTTGSMGGNVDLAMHALPDTYEAVSAMLPGRDLQLAQGIFGDCQSDRFPLNRPQFEMLPAKIVDYLSKMNPERRGGGNNGEDPQYGAFASAYLTDAYINRLGLKGYHFIYTDEPCHPRISARELERIFGKDVWDALMENGFDCYKPGNLPDAQDVFFDLSKRFHAFVLILNNYNYDAPRCWHRYYGSRAIMIDTCKDLPYIEAAIVGYTEGTLQPLDVEGYLKEHDVSEPASLACQISQLDFAAQRKLEKAFGRRIPEKGDIFRNKTDLLPDTSDAPVKAPEEQGWL